MKKLSDFNKKLREHEILAFEKENVYRNDKQYHLELYEKNKKLGYVKKIKKT